VQFLLIGFVVFAATHYVEHRNMTSERQIVVDRELSQRLARLYALQVGSQPNATELERLIEEYAQEEAIYREARRIGLDRDDEIVRRRLVQKLQFLHQDTARITQPTDVQLSAFLNTHASEFTEPARVSFQQIFFSPDRAGAADAERRARGLLAQVDAARTTHAVIDPSRYGDSSPLAARYESLTAAEARQLLGATPAALALFSCAVGQWVGPVQSGYGWHWFLVNERTEAVLPGLSAIKDQVLARYLDDARQQENAAQLSKLRARYELVRLDRHPS
jgi:hypothetical protein